MSVAIQTYEAMSVAMKMEWPELKKRLDDEKAVFLMNEYYAAFLAYDAVMDDRKGELRHLNRCYAKLANHLYGPIFMEHD